PRAFAVVGRRDPALQALFGRRYRFEHHEDEGFAGVPVNDHPPAGSRHAHPGYLQVVLLTAPGNQEDQQDDPAAVTTVEHLRNPPEEWRDRLPPGLGNSMAVQGTGGTRSTRDGPRGPAPPRRPRTGRSPAKSRVPSLSTTP